MALVFAEPGNPRSELTHMRCGSCRELKPMAGFPPSCSTFRRGSCRMCNRLKSIRKCADPLQRKLESARVRFGTRGGLSAADVALLYAREGLDWSDEDNLKRTYLAKERGDAPFGAANVSLRWRSEDHDPSVGQECYRVVRCG